MASEPYQYRGREFSHQRDKLRFVLPARFRKTVKESSGNRSILCIDQHHRWPCLIGFGLSRAEDFGNILKEEAQDAKDNGTPFDRELRQSQLNGFDELPFDDSGRFILTAYLGEIANVTTKLFFQGAGSVFTIWSPESLYKMGPEWAVSQAACRQLELENLPKAAKS